MSEPAHGGNEAFGHLLGLAGTLHDGVAVARADDEEGILAEERVPAHVLAAFDALEQERVVGVLGDLQERGHRGEQVRDDLLADGDERAPARQLLEFFERRQFHDRERAGEADSTANAARRSSAAVRISAGSAARPVQ